MNKLFLSLILLLSINLKAQLNDLIITEFVDWNSGSGFAIKIYNPTSSAINLSNYYFHYFTNGSASFAASEQLSGILSSNQSMTIANNPSDFTMPCTFDLVLTTITAGTNDNDGVAITRGPASVNHTASQFVDMINCFGTNVAPRIDGTARGLYKKTIKRNSNNCTRYTSINGVANNSWPASSSSNVLGWTVSSVGCLSGGNSFNPFYIQQTINVSFCYGDSALIGGRYIKSTGVYRDTLPAFNSCDSVVLYSVNVENLKVKSNSISICQGDSIFLQGAFQFAPGTYFDTILNSAGCDTLLTTTLLLNGVIRTSEQINLCEGDSYLFKGQNITSAGVYSDTSVTNGGCDSIHDLIVSINQAISINEVFTICDGESVNINGILVANSTTIQYMRQNPNGCDTLVDAIVNVINVNADYTYSKDPFNPLLYAFSATDQTGSQYFWDFGDGVTSTQLNPAHLFAPGVYFIKLLVIGENGCESYFEKQIVISEMTENLFIPNVFTPNNDGVNDVFKLTFNSPFQISILIYNRWGELLYESTDCYFEWNGRYKGRDAQSGTYVYIISGKYNQKGTLTLLR